MFVKNMVFVMNKLTAVLSIRSEIRLGMSQLYEVEKGEVM